MELKLNELAAACHKSAQDKGWYDEPNPRTPAEALLLITTEVAEIVEEIRKPNPIGKMYFIAVPGLQAAIDEGCSTSVEIASRGIKPEGESTEVADVLIRLLDYAVWRGIDIEVAVETKMAYNATRERRHGKKF